MASDGTQFSIDIDVPPSGAESAAAQVARLTSSLSASGSAALQAAESLKAGEAAYRTAETSADRAAKSVEKLALSVADQSGAAAAAASKFGLFSSEYQKASDKLQALTARQGEAAAKSAAASAAMNAEAVSLDRLKTAAGAAAAEEAKLVKSLDAAKSAAAATAKARSAASGSGKVNEMAEAFQKLGGPLGQVGGKAFQAADGLKKLGGSLGSAGPYAAIAIAITAIATAAIGATLAVSIWAIKLADKEGKIAKQSALLQKNISGVFGGLKIQGVLDGLDTMVNLFNKDTAAGNAMKVVFESIFQPIIDGIASLAPKAERLFIQMEILAMRAMIAIKPYGSILAGIGQTFAVVAVGVIGAFAVVVAVIVGVVAVLALVAVGIQWLIKQAVDAGAAFVAFGGSILGGFTTPVNDAIAFLKSLSLSEIGTALIDGLVAGLTGAGPRVIAAMSGMAGDAITAAKKSLGIASPSKVFAEIGMNTGAGMAEGVDGAAADVQGSLEALVAPPDAAPGAGVGTGPGSSSVTGGSHVFHITVTAGGSDTGSLVAAIREGILDLFEGSGAQLGAAVPA